MSRATQYASIYAALRKSRKPMTRHDIAERIDMAGLSWWSKRYMAECIGKRMEEMRRDGFVLSMGSRIAPETGKRCKTWVAVVRK